MPQTTPQPAPTAVVLFDFDGTLVDSTPAVMVSLQAASAELGLPAAEPAVLDAAIAAGVLMGDLVRQVWPQADAALVSRWLAAYQAHYQRHGLEHSSLFPGARAVLDQLQAQGYPLAIVSNKDQPSIHHALEHFGLAGHFRQVWGEQPGLPGKPSATLFEQRIRPAYPTIPAAQFLMIGDTIADRDFARASGLRFALVGYGYGALPLHADSPGFRLPALAELPAWLQPVQAA